MIQIQPETLAKIKTARVQMRNGGTGIVAQSGLIVTAAHCLDACRGEAPLFLSGAHIECFTTADDRQLFAKVLYAEIASDLAILGQFEGSLPKASADFLYATEGVEISDVIHSPGEIFPVEILTPRGTIHGSGEICGAVPSRFLLRTASPLQHGDSGSPIFSVNKLVGVVSSGGEDQRAAHIPLSLPLWLNAQTILKSK